MNKGLKRRDFLKVLGAGAGVVAAGCSRELPEKIIPYVVQPDDVIPGIALWYAGACNECSAGCGIMSRTREGRVVKLEGLSDHPINRGGLCARGQSALQSLYDPDRIREPLVRSEAGVHTVAAWPDAMAKAAEKLGDLPGEQEFVILTPEVSGSVKTLIDLFVSKVPRARHIAIATHGRWEYQRASELVFGKGLDLSLDFAVADVIVGVGADYLESWVSPVEFSKGWSKRRSTESADLSTVVHFEPRFSQTAANADRWVANAPGQEVSLLLAILKIVAQERSFGRGNYRSLLDAVMPTSSLDELAERSGVDVGIIRHVAKLLLEAKTPLVVAGGAACGRNADVCCALGFLLTALLGGEGKTLKLSRLSRPKGVSRPEDIEDFFKKLNQGKVGALLVSGLNPTYEWSLESNFQKSLAKVKTLLVHSLNLDETASMADVVFAASSPLESWWDAEPRPGVYNLNQPAMQPLYQTMSLGDLLLALARELKKPLSDSANTAKDFIQENARGFLASGNFSSSAAWDDVVQKGGIWSDSQSSGLERIAASGDLSGFKQLASQVEKATSSADSGLALMAFPTSLNWDGSTANRAWLQEIPDPMTSVVWDSWLEIHPETAKQYGVKQDDVARVKVGEQAVELPVIVHERIHRGLVAVPVGNGHTRCGRYANGVGANVSELLKFDPRKASVDRLRVGVSLDKASWKNSDLVTTQQFFSQLKRGLVEVSVAGAAVSEGAHSLTGEKHGRSAHKDNNNGSEHTGHHEPKQMYHQMEHVLERWGMTVDLGSCTGCSACVVACYAENNVPIVGKQLVKEGREMSWIRLDRYFDGPPERPLQAFQPMMCQHCGNAPCEPVCPVYATYHNEQGLNAMVYNRCVGTRYCSNNCSYKVRRFNWFRYQWPEPLTWQLNPDVTVREVGVMEKCSFCVQRIREATNNAKNEGRLVRDGEVKPACASSCPTNAITFGNLLDTKSLVARKQRDARAYKVLDHHINTQPAISYLKRVNSEKA